jgi:uncharacterized membrane protein
MEKENGIMKTARIVLGVLPALLLFAASLSGTMPVNAYFDLSGVAYHNQVKTVLSLTAEQRNGSLD